MDDMDVQQFEDAISCPQAEGDGQQGSWNVGVTTGGHFENAVDETNQTALVDVFRVRLKNHRTEYRRESERHDAGEDDGHGHRQGKLAVKHTDRTGHECHWDEHRGHHQGNGNDSSTDFSHHLFRCGIG